MWKRNIDADKLEQSGDFVLFVFFDGFSVSQNSGYGLDLRDEGYKTMPEVVNISDVEEDIELGLLWQTAPAWWDRQHCSIYQWERVYRISPWIFLRSRGVGVGAGVVDIALRCMWDRGLDITEYPSTFIPFSSLHETGSSDHFPVPY